MLPFFLTKCCQPLTEICSRHASGCHAHWSASSQWAVCTCAGRHCAPMAIPLAHPSATGQQRILSSQDPGMRAHCRASSGLRIQVLASPGGPLTATTPLYQGKEPGAKWGLMSELLLPTGQGESKPQPANVLRWTKVRQISEFWNTDFDCFCKFSPYFWGEGTFWRSLLCCFHLHWPRT